jgi:serine/threonine protein kinase
MDTDPQVTELLLRWQELRQQGQVVTAAELCAGCPELAGELERCLETVDHWEQFLDTGDEEGTPSPVPESFGKYRVVQPLGVGGQASTLKAWDPDLHCHVVLKLYHNARTAAEQDEVLKEGRALARVRSPYVARCYGIERQGGVPALVVEYVPGRNLRQEQQARPLGLGRALELTGQLAEGLAAVHACGRLHRDLKPDNVLLGDDGRPRLVDFGLAAELASAELASISGTLPYMAPEQARGEAERIDARTDVYGLGAVLYELLTGRPPHQGASWEEQWRAACAGDVVPPRQLNRRVPRAVNDLCLRCLAKDPTQRFSSASELAGAVRRLRRWRSWRLPLAAAALLLVPALALAVFVPRSFRDGRPAGDGTGPTVPSTQPVLVVRVWRPESRYTPLSEALPVRTGDELQVRFRVPAGLHIGLFSVNGEGRLALLEQYPPSDEPAEWVYPAPEQTRRLGPPPGTELLLVCGRSDGPVSEPEVRDAWGNAGTWPALDPRRLLGLHASQVKDEGEKPRDFLGAALERRESDPVLRRLDGLRERLTPKYPFFEGLAFRHD